MPKTEACRGCAILLAVLAIPYVFVSLAFWMDSKREDLSTPPPGANVNVTAPAYPECTDANWSAGSAFFTLTALTFGYYAHPPGCLILNRSGRTWRLSPGYVAGETFYILGRLYQGMKMYGHSFRVVCVTL